MLGGIAHNMKLSERKILSTWINIIDPLMKIITIILKIKTMSIQMCLLRKIDLQI